MSICPPPKPNVRVPPYLQKVQCRIKDEGVKPCPYVSLQDKIDAALQPQEGGGKKEEEKKGPCDDVKPPSKKKFEQLGLKNICAMPYTRHWTLEKVPCRRTDEFPKWYKRGTERFDGELKPRELDDYEKRLWAPICKPPDTGDEECMEPIDDNVCVFCKNGFYTDGYLHDLRDKVPLIKKQSELYGDEIAQRIGIRTRITVHKKCYIAYIDVLAHKKEEEGEQEIDLNDEVSEDSEDILCGDEEEEEEEDDEEDEKRKQAEKEKKKRRSERAGRSLLAPNINFCLNKFKIPPIDPGKLF